MAAIRFGLDNSDDERRGELYAGDLVVTTPSPASLALCEFARELTESAFDDLDPERAQFVMDTGPYAALLGDLKPRFIHHPRNKELLRDLLAEQGCDLEATYFDVPRLRSSTSDGYLTTGIAFAWHPHRDTWFSAPMAQVNWWVPIYPVVAENALAFHLEHFDRPVSNDSEIFNYYEYNQQFRGGAAQHIGQDTRPLPRPTEPVDLSTAVVPLAPVGGLTIFSGQQLHSSVPNTSGVTRYSIDFRTVNIEDIRNGRSAAPVDVACTGSTIRDFIRASDFSPMPDDIAELLSDGTENAGDLVYNAAGQS